MHVSAIIAAGGRGSRIGSPVPKQLLEVGGRPILQWSVDAFLGCADVADVIVVVPPALAVAPPDYLRVPRVTVVAGGARRQDSVANGFDALPACADVVIVHDAARPFVDQTTIARAIAAASATGAAIAAIPASETVKWSPDHGAPDGLRLIERTLSRDAVFLAQTPQAFRREVLADAIALGRGGVEATDEAALAERAGHRVELIEGSRRNLKVTTPDDLVIAEALLSSEGQRAPGSAFAARHSALGTRHSELVSPRSDLRVGTGYDLHRLVPGRPLVLGGIAIPFERGLAGHSDADVLSHAITDAILGAASLGDIGQHFPDTDPRWEGASSIDLLARAAAVVRGAGFSVVNVDAVVIAERPKIAPHIEGMRDRLAAALGIDRGRIAVKGKTNEGTGEIGRGEAMAVHAVALVASIVP